MSQFPKGKNFHKPITQNQNPTKNPISNFLPLSTQFQFSMSQIPISKTKQKKKWQTHYQKKQNKNKTHNSNSFIPEEESTDHLSSYSTHAETWRTLLPSPNSSSPNQSHPLSRSLLSTPRSSLLASGKTMSFCVQRKMLWRK